MTGHAEQGTRLKKTKGRIIQGHVVSTRRIARNDAPGHTTLRTEIRSQYGDGDTAAQEHAQERDQDRLVSKNVRT